MGRYYHPRKRRSFSYASYNASERHAIASGMAGIDDDVLKIFGALEGLRQKVLFSHYEAAHGKSAATYARNKMGEWACGLVNASGETRKRLLALVPKILTHGERYGLLKKLYDAHRGSGAFHEVTVVLGHQEDYQTKIADLANQALQRT